MYPSITLDWYFGLELAAATDPLLVINPGFLYHLLVYCSALVLLSFLLDIVLLVPCRLLFHDGDPLLPFLQVQLR